MAAHPQLEEALDFLEFYKRGQPAAMKAELEAAFQSRFSPRKSRSLFLGDGYALRFCEVRGRGFSNTVLALRKVQDHDENPLVVALVRASGVDFMLANSTFISKVGHSSHELRPDRVVGSVNGPNIVREFEGLANVRRNFDALLEIHCDVGWDDNFARILDATQGIVPRSRRFEPTDREVATILEAPLRAERALQSEDFLEVIREVEHRVVANREAILHAASVDNVNLRGNSIERVILGRQPDHGVHDLVVRRPGLLCGVDIKSKSLERKSAPKGYSVDRMLQFLAQADSVSLFLLVRHDIAMNKVSCIAAPILDSVVLEATRLQAQWSGRVTRGATKLLLDQLESHWRQANYRGAIDVRRATSYLEELLLR